MKMEGVSTFIISSYLQALNRQLTLFENACLCVWKYFEICQQLGNFVMILVSVKNAYKVFVFENISEEVFV